MKPAMSARSGADAPEPEVDLFAAALIHELRQPLMGVKAGLLLAGSELGSEATRLEAWQLLATQVERLEELFHTWHRLLARPDAPDVPFDVEPVVRSTLGLLSFRLKPLGARFSLQPGAGLPLALGARPALVHALTILVANALDALAEAAGGRLEVRLLPPVAAGAGLEVRVSDEGPGVAPALAERIFERGFTTKARDVGSGLGLYLARRLVRDCGGEVALVPEDDARRCPWARTELAITLRCAGEAA